MTDDQEYEKQRCALASMNLEDWCVDESTECEWDISILEALNSLLYTRCHPDSAVLRAAKRVSRYEACYEEQPFGNKHLSIKIIKQQKTCRSLQHSYGICFHNNADT